MAKKAQNFVGWLARSTLRKVQPNQPDRMSEITIQTQPKQANDHQTQNIESVSTRLSHALSLLTSMSAFHPKLPLGAVHAFDPFQTSAAG
jgi:hypothetical protein